MAPNNGPPNNGPGTTRPENNGTKNSSSGSTTVLPKGTVESRGMGTHAESRDVVSKEIQDFLHGEGKLSFWAEVRGFFTVWMFVTRLPSPSWVDVHPGEMLF